MGEKDITLKDYLSAPKRYADLLNGSIFHGRQIINAGELQDADTVPSKSDELSIIERIISILLAITDQSFRQYHSPASPCEMNTPNSNALPDSHP